MSLWGLLGNLCAVLLILIVFALILQVVWAIVGILIGGADCEKKDK